ncbi:MAG: hypothetical protein HQ488_01135 [Parcubacteria group bacterium]|nr:hypothetical protein [Parcubacteria group bacterium]
MRKHFWLIFVLAVASVMAGCATVTRTVDTTPVDLDEDGEAETTRESVSVRYVGSLPPRPSVILSASDDTPSKALELAGRSIDAGMVTNVITNEHGVSVSATPVPVYGSRYYGSPGTYAPNGGVHSGVDVVRMPDGTYQRVGGGSSLPQLQTTRVVSIPATPVRVTTSSSSGEVKCPEKGKPAYGTPEFDACVEPALKAALELSHGH